MSNEDKIQEIIEFEKEFVKEEKEILILTSENSSCAMVGKFYLKPSLSFLAYVDVETGKLYKNEGMLKWMVERGLKKENYGYDFKKLTIYKVRVRKCIDKELEPNKLPIWNNRYLLLKVLERNVKHPDLDKIREEYLKPVILKTDICNFTLNKKFKWFEAKLDWVDTDIEFFLNVTNDTKNEKLVEIFQTLYKNKENWDKKAKEYAAKELTDGANDWQETDEITKEDFANRILLTSITISSDGDLEFYFYDDDMFYGHTIIVNGNISGTFTSADIAG